MQPAHHTDTGCHLEPKCCSCPRPISKCPAWNYGFAGEGDTHFRPRSDHEGIKEALLEGRHSVRTIAHDFGVGERTVREIRRAM